jgi:hypothetical protein
MALIYGDSMVSKKNKRPAPAAPANKAAMPVKVAKGFARASKLSDMKKLKPKRKY